MASALLEYAASSAAASGLLGEEGAELVGHLVTSGSDKSYRLARSGGKKFSPKTPAQPTPKKRKKRKHASAPPAKRHLFHRPQRTVPPPQRRTSMPAYWRKVGPFRQAKSYGRRARAAITRAKRVRRRYRAARSYKTALRRRITARGQSVKAYGAMLRRNLRAGLYRKKKRTRMVATLKQHDPVLVLKRQLHWWGGYMIAHIPGDPQNPLGSQSGFLPQEPGQDGNTFPKYYKHFYNRHKRFYPVVHNTVVKTCCHFKDFYSAGGNLQNIYQFHPNLLALARAPTAPNVHYSAFSSKDGWTDNMRIRPLGITFKVHIDTTYSANWAMRLVLVKGKHNELNKYDSQDKADPTLNIRDYHNTYTDSEGSTYTLSSSPQFDERNRLMLQSTDGLQCTAYHTTKPADFWDRGGMGYRALPYKNQAQMNVLRDPLDRKDFDVVASWYIKKPSSIARAVNAMNVPYANDLSATKPTNPDGHQQDEIHNDAMSDAKQGDDTAAVHVTPGNYTGDDHMEIHRTFTYKFKTGYKFDFDPAPHKLRGAQHERWADDPTINYPDTTLGPSPTYWKGTIGDTGTVDQRGFSKNAHGLNNNYQLYIMAYDTMAQNPTRQLFFMNIESHLTYRNGADSVNHGI